MNPADFHIETVAEILGIDTDQALRLVQDALVHDDPFNCLSDLLGLANIELIFEIFKNKQKFTPKELRNEHALYIEHIVPETPAVDRSATLLATAAAGDNACYFPYSKFNPVQSAVFNSIYNTDENVLISAPTGAGKTDIALLATLRALRAPASQVIYIVPMKALASEIYRKYSRLLDAYKVIEYTGDTEIDGRTAAGARVVVCTPEKFDTATRKLCCVFQNIKLVVIDEIHLLEDDRGPVIEAVVARMYRTSELKQSLIRIVGLSATLPNYGDVAQFIRAVHVHAFDATYRPVPLKMTVTGFIKGATQTDEMDYIVEKTQQFLDGGKQVMIFVHSRARTVKHGAILAKRLAGLPQQDLRGTRLTSELHRLVSNSIGVHHAGLGRSDRSEIEGLFMQGRLKVLVTTATLAWGVNLPAYAVILHGTAVYDQAAGQFGDISVLDVLQIFGRAGRPQFDTRGEAILVTAANKMDKFIGLLKRNQAIESRVLYRVPELLNAEIYLGNVTSVAEALVWIQHTFLYVRMMKNPARYGINAEDLSLEDQALSEYVYLTLRRLEDCKLIDVARRDESYTVWAFKATPLGQIVSMFYLDHLTMYGWLGNLGGIKNENSIIMLLLRSEEFKRITVRRDEVAHLNAIHRDLLLRSVVDFEFDETVEHKLVVLLQAHLHHVKMPVFSLACDCDFVVENLKRLVVAMKGLFCYARDYCSYLIVFELERRLCRGKRGVLEGIGVRGIKLSENFVELCITGVKSPLTVVVYGEEGPTHVFAVAGDTREVFKEYRSRLRVEIYSEWRVQREEVVLDVAEAGQGRYGGADYSKIEYVRVEYSGYNERLQAMTNLIHQMRTSSLLVVCPSRRDAAETRRALNTKALLADTRVGLKFGTRGRFVVATLEGVAGAEADTVVLKGAGDGTGLYAVEALARLFRGRRAIVLEGASVISYLASVFLTRG